MVSSSTGTQSKAQRDTGSIIVLKAAVGARLTVLPVPLISGRALKIIRPIISPYAVLTATGLYAVNPVPAKQSRTLQHPRSVLCPMLRRAWRSVGMVWLVLSNTVSTPGLREAAGKRLQIRLCAQDAMVVVIYHNLIMLQMEYVLNVKVKGLAVLIFRNLGIRLGWLFFMCGDFMCQKVGQMRLPQKCNTCLWNAFSILRVYLYLCHHKQQKM